MGIDYRIVNGYVYITGNPVTDPEQIAERAEFFQRRAGYYYEHWDELYEGFKRKMEVLIDEITNLHVPDLPKYEPEEVMERDDKNTAYVELLDAYQRTLRCGDLMWQHHFEFLLLGYGAYLTFADLCKHHLPDIPDQHIAQMVAGIDVLLFSPDAELRRLSRLAIDTGVDAAFVEGRTPAEIEAELANSDAGRGVARGPRAARRTPWFNMATGDGLYHFYGSWYDDPSIPYASMIGYIAALKAGEEVERPTEEIRSERDRLAEEYGALFPAEAARAFDDLLASRGRSSRTSRSTSSCCDYWFLTRWWKKVREFGALLARHGFLEDERDVFHLSRHEVTGALDELLLTWATGGVPLGPSHWPPIVARRRELLAEARRVEAAAGDRRHAGGDHRPRR